MTTTAITTGTEKGTAAVVVNTSSAHSTDSGSTAATTTPTSASTDSYSEHSPCCPNCGFSLPNNDLTPTEQAALLASAQRQIADLEAQVRLLNQKAAAAVDRWADYEDELARMRSQLFAQDQQQSSPSRGGPSDRPGPVAVLPTPPNSAPPVTPSPRHSSFLASATGSAASRISALLSSRASANAAANKQPLKPLPAPVTGSPRKAAPPPPIPSPIPSLPSSYVPFSPPPSVSSASTSTALSTEDLLEALSREQQRRLEAEGRLSETSREVEELSVSLFEQANEMVASERRARARLEERVETLEKRDADKRRRLDRLEGALGRIQRGRAVLGDTVG